MNAIYKVIWNKNRQVWQAVSECASSNGKATKASNGNRQGASLSLKSLLSRVAAGSLLIITLPSFVLANNLPTGGQVTAGNGQISSNGQQMTINQTSQKMVVDWQGFSIGKDASVNFVQPNAQAAALNRVLGDQVSNIRGALNANGQVFLVNPNGILFSPSARVDVGSLVASTLNITNQNFMDGNYRFEGSSGNAVINQGNIQTLNGGTVAFIAAKIINTGSISTPKGNTLMGAGNKVILDLGGPVKIEVEASELETYIEQGGAIKADGGTVYLTAKAANALTSNVINHTGITQAQTLASGEDGTIMLMGDMNSGLVQVAGTLDASAPTAGDGGFVETSAAKVKVDDNFRVKANKWLIDPVDFTIAASGGDMSGATISTNLATTDVTIMSTDGATEGDGNIYVNDEITWSSDKILSLLALNDIFINKDITATNGKLGFSYGSGASAVGNTSDYHVNAKINLSAGQNFVTVVGNEAFSGNNDYVTMWTVVDASNMNTAMNADKTKNYALGGDVILSGTNNWTPIGDSSVKFTGKFDGLGHTISNLNIAEPNTNNIGLFGYTNGATIQNIGVLNADVGGQSFVGILVGKASSSTIKNSYTTGKVTAKSSAGGLVGLNKGSISNSYATGKVTGTADTVGGLVGKNEAMDGETTITNSYATGEVSGTGSVGGLVGMNSAMSMNGIATANISNSYATGKVTGTSSVGGLVGSNSANGEMGGTAKANISNSYASNSVTGGSNVGGLVGKVSEISGTSTITNSFYDNEKNSATEMVDVATYGKSKSNIMTALSGKADWGTDGSEVSGYATDTIDLPFLKGVTKFQNTLFAGGFGTAESAYTITNWNQLQNINYNSDTVAGGYYYTLANDLLSTTNGYTTQVKDGETLANSGSGWSPIGNNSDKFTGTFDGLNNSIQDLQINRATQDNIGLFGFAEEASIKNIHLVNADIKASNYSAGLVGSAKNLTIENVSFKGKLVGVQGVGAILGSASNSSISNAQAAGSITGNYAIGGLVGKLFALNGEAKIENAYSNAQVSEKEVNGMGILGGLVGEVFAVSETDSLTITNAYATGDITSTNSNVGGLIGKSSKINLSNAYATGKVEGRNLAGGLIGYDNSSIITHVYAIGKSSEENDSSAQGLFGFTSNTNITNAWYNKTTNPGKSDENDYGKTQSELLAAFIDKENWSTGAGANAAGYEIALHPYLTSVTKDADKSLTTLFAGGMGVDGDAYTITNWTQLQNINNSNILTQDYYFKLSNNLDSATAGYTTQVKDGTTLANGGIGWISIGNINSSFKGKFDGKSHNISDLYIDRIQQGQGLFGFVTGDITNKVNIKNINLIDVNIKGSDSTGALAGYANFANIENINSSGTIIGSQNIGGLVGNIDVQGVTLKNSFSTVDVTGTQYVGGLAGANYGTIENSYATGEVAGTGTVFNKTIGGLVGENYGTIEKSYAIGKVTGTSNLGGLVGKNDGGTISNSFYDKTINAGMSDETAYGKTTTQMQDKATFVDWNIAEDSTLPSTYLYPVLVTDAAGVTSWKIAKVTTSIKYTLSDVINNYIYNGTSQLPTEWLSSTIFGDTYSGWTLGTDYKLVHNTAAVTGFKDAGTYENVSVEVLKTGFVIDSTSKNGKFVIAPKEVGISTSKVYDGNVNFNSGFTVKTNDIISGDTVTVSGVLATASKNVGNYTNFTSNNLALSNANYKVGTTTAAITKKAITISGITASDKTYDGSTAALVNTGSVGGWIAGDNVQVMVAGNFINEEVGVNKLINLSSTYSGDDANNYHFIDQPTTSASIIANSPVEPPAPTPVEPPAPTPVEPPAPTPVEPPAPTPVEPPAPTPVEPPAPTPVEPPAPTPVEPPAPAPVEPPIPVAPLDKPIQQVIANIQQTNSNTFTPANNNARSNSLPTTRGNAVNNINPNTGATRQIQQSGNLELVEVDEALAGQLTGLGGNTGPLMPVFVMQGGINLDGLTLNSTTTGLTNDER